jgi:hypothetical protein
MRRICSTKKNCAISVRFKPTGKGSVSGSLTITGNPSNEQQVVNLSGTDT